VFCSGHDIRLKQAMFCCLLLISWSFIDHYDNDNDIAVIVGTHHIKIVSSLVLLIFSLFFFNLCILIIYHNINSFCND